MATTPGRKGLRSLIKGAIIIGSYLTGFGALGATLVGLYNGVRSVIGLAQRKATHFLGYGAGALLAFAGFPTDILYGAGLGATGAYRIARNKPVFYDNPLATSGLGSAAPYVTGGKF